MRKLSHVEAGMVARQMREDGFDGEGAPFCTLDDVKFVVANGYHYDSDKSALTSRILQEMDNYL